MSVNMLHIKPVLIWETSDISSTFGSYTVFLAILRRRVVFQERFPLKGKNGPMLSRSYMNITPVLTVHIVLTVLKKAFLCGCVKRSGADI
jgi:hypothetical protein